MNSISSHESELSEFSFCIEISKGKKNLLRGQVLGVKSKGKNDWRSYRSTESSTHNQPSPGLGRTSGGKAAKGVVKQP